MGDFVLGKAVNEFEEKIAAYCGTKYALGVNSGTDALIFALKVYEIGEGDELSVYVWDGSVWQRIFSVADPWSYIEGYYWC